MYSKHTGDLLKVSKTHTRNTSNGRPKYVMTIGEEKLKKRNRLLPLFLVVVLTLTMVLSACGGNQPGSNQPSASQPSASQPREDVVIIMGLPNSWNHLMPLSPPSAYQIEVCTVIYDLLTRKNEAGDIEPRAAESWFSSDDLKTLTLNLRKDLYWHDGKQVTAKDWKFTFDLMTSEYANECISQSKFNLLAGTDLAGVLQPGMPSPVETPDDFTFVLNFKEPMSAFSFFTNYAYTLFVLPEHILSGLDANNLMEWDFWKAPIGSGPCRFVSESNATEIILDAVDNYPIGELQFDRLIYRVVASDAAVSALLAGEINAYYYGFTSDALLPLAGVPGTRTQLMSNVSTFSALCMNNDIYDANFRKAMNYALDKELIVESIYFGDADPTNSSVRANSPFVIETWKGRDVALAKEYLAKSSWKPGGPPLKLACAPGIRTQIATVMQQNFAELGVQIEIMTQDQPAVLAGLSDGTYDMGIFSGSSSSFPTWITNMPIFFQNLCHILDQSLYFEYRNRLSIASEDAEIAKIAAEFQAFWEDEMPAAPMQHAYGWYIFSDWLQNVTAIETSAAWTWVVNK